MISKMSAKYSAAETEAMMIDDDHRVNKPDGDIKHGQGGTRRGHVQGGARGRHGAVQEEGACAHQDAVKPIGRRQRQDVWPRICFSDIVTPD